VDPKESIQREDCLSLGKLAESFILLGWEINTRRLTISIPTEKYKKWNSDLGMMIFRKKSPLRYWNPPWAG